MEKYTLLVYHELKKGVQVYIFPNGLYGVRKFMYISRKIYYLILTVIPARAVQKMRVLAADYNIDFFNKVDKLKKML